MMAMKVMTLLNRNMYRWREDQDVRSIHTVVF